MQNPFYIQQADLVENYGRGYEVGAMQREDKKAQQAEAANAEMQQQFQNDIYEIYQNPNATSKDYRLLQIKYPAMSTSIQKDFDSLSAEQQSSRVSEATEVLSAINSGKPEYAVKLLRDKAEAYRNSGDDQNAKLYEDKAKSGELDPQILKIAAASTLNAIKGGDYVDSLNKQPYSGIEAEAGAKQKQAEAYIKGAEAENAPIKNELENQEKGANIANTRNQIEDRAVKNDTELKKLAFEEKKAAYAAAKDSGISLDKDSREFINTKAGDASFKNNNANRASALSAKLDKIMGAGGGATAAIGEGASSIWGNKDDESAVRAEVQRVLTPIAMSNYKKFTSGATSDRDIETAMGGYPKPTDSPEVLASFLRGLDKMQRYDANIDKAMVGWTSNVGSLADAPRDFEYKGIPIPKGTSYSEFEQMYIDKLVGDGANDKGGKKTPTPAKLKGKSYMQGNW